MTKSDVIKTREPGQWNRAENLALIFLISLTCALSYVLIRPKVGWQTASEIASFLLQETDDLAKIDPSGGLLLATAALQLEDDSAESEAREKVEERIWQLARGETIGGTGNRFRKVVFASSGRIIVAVTFANQLVGWVPTQSESPVFSKTLSPNGYYTDADHSLHGKPISKSTRSRSLFRTADAELLPAQRTSFQIDLDSGSG